MSTNLTLLKQALEAIDMGPVQLAPNGRFMKIMSGPANFRYDIAIATSPSDPGVLFLASHAPFRVPAAKRTDVQQVLAAMNQCATEACKDFEGCDFFLSPSFYVVHQTQVSLRGARDLGDYSMIVAQGLVHGKCHFMPAMQQFAREWM